LNAVDKTLSDMPCSKDLYEQDALDSKEKVIKRNIGKGTLR